MSCSAEMLIGLLRLVETTAGWLVVLSFRGAWELLFCGVPTSIVAGLRGLLLGVLGSGEPLVWG